MINQKWFDFSVDEMIGAQTRLLEIEEEFFRESLRNIALVGTSKIDFLLIDILSRFMKKQSGGTKHGILERLTFENRIDLCFGVGLIDGRLAKGLHFFRRVRNVFAHQTSIKSFDIQELTKLHTNLRDEYMYMIMYSAYSNNEKIKGETQLMFVSVMAYFMGLLNLYVERVREVSDEQALNMKSIAP